MIKARDIGRSPVPTYHPDKLRALVHYICFRAPNPRTLGTTKLNKILFYSDMEAYLQLGEPITGETYIKHQYGPVSQHLAEALKALEDERAIAISEASGYNTFVGEPYMQRLYFSLRRPPLDLFSADEISIADQMVGTICEAFSAREISDLSHDIVWESAEIGEALPYETAFVHTLGQITPEDLDWAEDLLRKRGRHGAVSQA